MKNNNNPKTQKRQILVLTLLYVMIDIALIHPPYINEFNTYIYTLSGKYYPLFFWKDSAFHVSFYLWWIYAISHALNPFFDPYLWFPHNMNPTHVTSIPTLSLLLWPVTAVYGALVSYNIVETIIPILNSLSALLLLLKITRSNYLAAFIGSLFYGFSPYVWGHLPLHPTFSAIFIPPIIVWLFMLWRENKVSSLRYSILTGILLALQVGISLEVFAYCVLAGTIAYLLFMKRIDLKDFFIVFSPLAIATVICLPLFYYFFFYDDMSTVPSLAATGSDLYLVIFPSAYLLLHYPGINYAKYFNLPENTLYISPILVAFLIVHKKHFYNKLLWLFLLFVLISMGTPFVWHHTVTPIVNPFGFVHFLPMFNHAVIGRFSLFVWLTISVIISLIISSLISAHHQIKYLYIWVALLLIVYIPNPSYGSWLNLSENIGKTQQFPIVPKAYTDPKFVRMLSGKSVIMLPLRGLGDLWQAQSSFAFKIVGGYTGLYYPPKPYPQLSGSLFGPLDNHGVGVANVKWAKRLGDWCKKNDIYGIVMDPDPWSPMNIVSPLRRAGWIIKVIDGQYVMMPPNQH